MAQAAPAQITCRVCDGWYATDSELRNHMQAAHRRFVHEPSNPQDAGAQAENVKSEPRTPNEVWTNEEASPVTVRAGRAGR